MSTTKELLEQNKAALKARMPEIRADIDAIKAASATLRADRDALLAQSADIAAQIQDKTDEINAIEQPRLFELKQELAEVARAAGAISLGKAA